MKIMLTFLGLLVLMVNFGVARQQHGESCGFDVQGEPAQPTITGPDDIVPLVYVVEQPDSPVEVVSVDLQGMSLSVSNDQFEENTCAKYEVRNRSNRVILAFDIDLLVSGGPGGAGHGSHSSSPLAAGQTVEIKSCGGGHGGAPRNHVRLLVSVRSVDFEDCLYRPSLRIPRSLGVHPAW